MDFSFTEEQNLFRRSVREFCEKNLAPHAAGIDETGEIHPDVIRNIAAAAIAAEEIARADISMATAVYYLVEAGWGHLFEKYGTEEAKREILPGVTKGESFLGIASTEATGGSDIASTSTLMEKKNGKLILNGTKTYISGVREAAKYGGGFVTIVKTEMGVGHKGLSFCYLPVKDQPGVTVDTLKQMGREGMSNGIININNAQIPEYYLIGEWNKGFYYAMEGFNCARTLVAAACIGAAQRALELGIEYLKERNVFGSSLSKFEGIQFQVAENYIKLESARLLVHKAAWMLDNGSYSNKDLNKAIAAAKLAAPTAAFDVIKEVMMWLGAYGYTREAGLERGLRGVTSYIIGAEGAQNIMRLIIARELLGKE